MPARARNAGTIWSTGARANGRASAPGAHGRLNLGGARVATEAWRLPKAWLERVERAGSGERLRAPLTRGEQVEELLVMGLRLAEGIELARLAEDRRAAGGRAARPRSPSGRFVEDGWLERRPGAWPRPPPAGSASMRFSRALLAGTVVGKNGSAPALLDQDAG